MRPQTVSNDKILKIAREIFLEQGPQVSVEIIAKELGLSQPALFKRFGTKRNLMLNSMKIPKRIEWFEKIEDGPDDRSFEIQLKEVSDSIALFLKSMQPVFQFLTTTDISPLELMPEGEIPPPVKGLKKLTEWLERCYEKGLIRKVDFRQAAMGVMGSIQFNAFAQTFIKTLKVNVDFPDKEESVDNMIDLFLNGLKRD